MNQERVRKALDIVKYSSMILILILLVYIFFFETNNFCVEGFGQADADDLGKKCFRTLTDANTYKLEMIEKYGLDKVYEPTYYINNS